MLQPRCPPLPSRGTAKRGASRARGPVHHRPEIAIRLQPAPPRLPKAFPTVSCPPPSRPVTRRFAPIAAFPFPSSDDGGAALGFGPGLALFDVDVVGEAEDALGDDVAEDLGGAAADGQRRAEEEAGDP